MTIKTDKRESTEWIQIYWHSEPDKTKKRIMLIGDSIVCGHTGCLHGLLKESKIAADYYATSKCVSDKDYRTELDYAIGSHEYELIIYNNGLHGFDIDEKTYAENLKETLTYLKGKVKRLVWRNSTPMRIPSNLSSPHPEKAERIIKRNQDAAEIVAELGIPSIDLHTPMSRHIEFFCNDGVHYNDNGVKFQAEFLADYIKKNYKELIN